MTASKLKRNWQPLVLLPLMLLAGCATQPTISASACPELPPKPHALQPAPQQAYSLSAAQNINAWQQRLTATVPTPTSALPPGQSE